MADKQVQALLSKLQKFYWSPQHPSTYVLPQGVGLGSVAHQNYAAFSVAWATCNKLQSPLDHKAGIQTFRYMQTASHVAWNGFTMQDLIQLCTPAELKVLMPKLVGHIPDNLYALLNIAIHAALPELSGLQQSDSV